MLKLTPAKAPTGKLLHNLKWWILILQKCPWHCNHICSHRKGDHRKRKTFNTRQKHRKQG